jgi:hypothetical protein
MIRLRLTCIPADLALIAGRERFSRQPVLEAYRRVPYPFPSRGQ